MENKQIILSFTDIFQSLKKNRFFIFAAAFLCGCATLAYLLIQPVRFTANGIFNGQVSQTASPFGKALELLGREDFSVSPSEQLFLLNSAPILEGVVKKLNLQAKVIDKKRGERLLEIWYTLKAERGRSKLKGKKYASDLYNSKILAPTELIIPDLNPSLVCEDVTFNSEISQTLKINFLDDKSFTVSSGKTIFGKGELTKPFSIPAGSFTLSGSGQKGKTIRLHFIPMATAIDNVKSFLKVKKNKENTALIDVSFSHRNRQLAAKIVNVAMEQIQDYLMLQGKKKINKQLCYLKQRQEETLLQLDETLQQEKAYLEANLDSGMILVLEKELEFMAKEQALKTQLLLQTKEEMQKLCNSLGVSFELIESLKENIPLQSLTIESARKLFLEEQALLERTRLENKKYLYCLGKLKEDDFSTVSLAALLTDENLRGHFKEIQRLHHNLVDAKNRTNKECEQLKSALELEKRFLTEQIALLKEGCELHAYVLEEKIQERQLELLHLLHNQHNQLEESLNDLKKQAVHFPQKWLNERKMKIQAKLYGDMMESVTKLVETKNIGYNIDYLMSNALQIALDPVIPNSPRLKIGTFFGAFGGMILVFLALCSYQVWIGPSASRPNLNSAGFFVAPEQETAPNLALKLGDAQFVLLLSKAKVTCAEAIKEFWQNLGENVFLLELKSSFSVTDHFIKELKNLKNQYDRILILYQGLPEGVATKMLISYADATVYGITNERLAEIKELSPNTFFFIQQQEEKMFALREITPHLAKLLNAFSSVKQAWIQFSTKNL